MKFLLLYFIRHNSAECRMQSAELWKFFAKAKNIVIEMLIFYLVR